MAKKPRIEGADAVKERLKTINREVKKERLVVAVKGMLAIKRSSMMNAPARESNLRGSAFVIMPKGEEGSSGTFAGEDQAAMAAVHELAKGITLGDVKAKLKRGLAAAIGHSAFYAQSVHENPNAGAAGYDPTQDQPITRGPRKGQMRRAEEVHSAVGGWKFLENAVKKHRRWILTGLKGAYDSGIKRGATK